MARILFTAVEGSVSIRQTAPDIIAAPAAVWLEARDHESFSPYEGGGSVYDGAFHEILHVWTVRDQPLAPFEAPKNMVPQWNNPNIAYGKKVVFRFPRPGQYIVDLWCVDRRGIWAEAETEVITVVDADEAYPGAQTICYSEDPDETWDGAPDGARRVSNLSALSTELRVDRGASPHRVLFKRGQTITPTSTLTIDSARDLSHVGGWGLDSARPKFVSDRRLNAENMIRLQGGVRNTQLTIADIEFAGMWDSTREVGFLSNHPVFWRDVTRDCMYHIHNCTWNGFSNWGMTTNNNASPETYIAVTDCLSSNWCNYAVFVGGGANNHFAALGCRFAQHEDALGGVLGKGGMGNQHGPIRISRTDSAYLSCLDLFARGGWSGGIRNVFGHDEPTDQPCLRLVTSGDVGSSAIMDRIVCEGGYHQIKVSSFGTSETVNPGNFLIDRALLIGSSKSATEMIYVGHGGTTVRNVIGFIPDTPARQNSNPPNLVGFRHQDDAGAGNFDHTIAAYNNTAVNLRTSGAAFEAVTIAPEWSDFVVENNLTEAPNIAAAVSANPGLDSSVSMPGIKPRFRGVRFNFVPLELSSGHPALPAGDLQNGESFTIPYANLTDLIVGDDPAQAAPTDQAYWQQVVTDMAAAGLPMRHTINPASAPLMYSEIGDFTVAFETAGVVVTNTSGRVWPLPGNPWLIRLDRAVRIPDMDDSYENPDAIPLLRPESTKLSSGRTTPRDFLGQDRNGQIMAGALLP